MKTKILNTQQKKKDIDHFSLKKQIILLKPIKTVKQVQITDTLGLNQNISQQNLPKIKKYFPVKKSLVLDQVKPYQQPYLIYPIKCQKQQLNLQKYNISYDQIKQKIGESNIVLGTYKKSDDQQIKNLNKSVIIRSDTFTNIFNQ